MKNKPFIRKGYRLKLAVLAISAFLAALLALIVHALPSNATAGEAQSSINVHLLGYHTASKVSVPLDDGVTVSPTVIVSTAYDQSYSIDYTLDFDDEDGTETDDVYTKRTTLSSDTLGDGRDQWTLNLDTIGMGYGTYTLTAIAKGTGKSTDVITFRYVPVHAKYVGVDDNSNPIFNVTASTSASIDHVKFKVYRSTTTTPVASTLPFSNGDIMDDGTTENQLTLPLDGFTGISTNTYSVDFEGVSDGTALGYAFTAELDYTEPESSESDTPDMNGEGDAAVLVAAGAAVAVASKRRNS